MIDKYLKISKEYQLILKNNNKEKEDTFSSISNQFYIVGLLSAILFLFFTLFINDSYNTLLLFTGVTLFFKTFYHLFLLNKGIKNNKIYKNDNILEAYYFYFIIGLASTISIILCLIYLEYEKILFCGVFLIIFSTVNLFSYFSTFYKNSKIKSLDLNINKNESLIKKEKEDLLVNMGNDENILFEISEKTKDNYFSKNELLYLEEVFNLIKKEEENSYLNNEKSKEFDKIIKNKFKEESKLKLKIVNE